MKKILKLIGRFTQNVVEEFTDWAKFIVASSLCIVILAIAWAGGGIGGKDGFIKGGAE
jgi:hypothetical protein